VRKGYLPAMVAVCLSGAALALLGFFLTPRPSTIYASPVKDTAATPDLIISVYAADETVLANEVISFTLLYTNAFGSPLSDVVITSTLSPKQIYSDTQGYLSDPIISTDSFTCSGDFDGGYTLEWQLGTLAVDAQGWIAVTTTLPITAEPPLKDSDRWPLLGMSAVITTSTPGATAGNPQGQAGDDASVMVVGPVLQITKGTDPETVRPGRLLTYTLTVKNLDRADVIAATGIVITDALPVNTSYVVGSCQPAPCSYDSISQTVTWNPTGSLARDSTMAVTFTVRITETFPSCPPPKIKNISYRVSSDETIRPVTGKKLETTVDDVLEKTIETPDPPPRENEVFPGGIVTYTISIYNPYHDQPLTDLQLGDVLPGTPNLFTFLNMVDGDPTIPTPVVTSPHVIWENLSVDAGDMISFSFSAWVPYHIDLGSASRDYKNFLWAFVPDLVICDMQDQEPSKAKVTRQIKLDKSVEPSLVLSGEMVTYTISLANLGDTDISDIRLTDTLPADFYYVEMVHGPNPIPEYRHNPVVWDNLVVPANSAIWLSFRAIAIGRPLQEYVNTLSASSPWTTIPEIRKAKVKIASPFSLNKSVDPSEIFIDETWGNDVEYDILICNVATGTYTIDGVADITHPGFVVDGPQGLEGAHHLVDYPLGSSVDLEPNDCFTYTFGADVTMDLGCGKLPHTYWNETGNVGFHVEDDPEDLWYVNTIKLAPLLIKPHVMVQKESNHAAVLPGETIVYTITLTNISNIPVHDITIVDTLPGDGSLNFVYSDTIVGPPPNDTTPPRIIWENQSVSGQGGQLVLAFRARVPEGILLGNYSNDVSATTTDPVCIESIAPTARLEVTDEIIELTKEVKPEEVPPLGAVRYEIKLKNKDSVPITGVVVTETLPRASNQDFVFLDMVPGDPEPTEIRGRQVIWRNLTIPGDETVRLRFDVQVIALYGQYNNAVDAWCPRSQTITPKVPPGVTAPVDVLPGVLVEKTVFPTQTTSGGILVYTITLHNQSKDRVENVLITDTLPAGFTYWRRLSDHYPLKRSPVVVWKVDIAKQAFEEIIFEVRVRSDTPSGTYYNKVEGYSPDALIPGLARAAPVIVEATGVPFVSLHKTVSPTQTVNGGSVVYTVTLENLSSDNFADVRITDTLPLGFSFVQMLGSDPTSPVTTSPQLVWELDELRRYAREEFVFEARVGYEVVSGTYSNTARAFIPPYTTLEAEETPLVEVLAIVEPGIFLSKTVLPTHTVNGGVVTYTIVMTNLSDSVLENAYITEILPDGFSFLQMDVGPSPVLTTPQVEWELGQVDIGENLELVFQVQVGLEVRSGTYTNTVRGWSPPFTTFGVEGTAPVAVDAIMPSGFVSKTAFPTQTMGGGIVTYTITLDNRSGGVLESVRITDTLPDGFTFHGMPGLGATLVLTAPQVVWELGQIGPHESQDLVFQAQVGLDVTPGVYSNAVEAHSPSALILGIEEAAPVQVRPGGLLSKAVFPTQAVNGGIVTYTITLDNQSGDVLESVRITDTLPDGFAFHGTPGISTTLVLTSPQVVWDLERIGPEDSPELILEAQVGPNVAPGTYFNSVEGYSPSGMILGARETAPVSVEGTLSVFLPLVLRN